jgi:hypothetical protein
LYAAVLISGSAAFVRHAAGSRTAGLLAAALTFTAALLAATPLTRLLTSALSFTVTVALLLAGTLARLVSLALPALVTRAVCILHGHSLPTMLGSIRFKKNSVGKVCAWPRRGRVIHNRFQESDCLSAQRIAAVVQRRVWRWQAVC